MGTEFRRLRRKNALWRILRVLMTLVAVAGLLAGGLMAMFKLTSTDGRVLLCIGIGAAAGLLAAVLRWLLLRRSDLRAAEQMDREHSLKERVQTMVAFRGQDGAMLEMQRSDTEERLKAVRSYGVKKASVFGHIAVTVLAVAALVGALILPARAEVEPPVYVEPDYNASAWQLASLDELIVHVQDSNMNAQAKEQTVTELQSLRTMLEGSVTVSVFKAQVLETITNVYLYTDRVNSNDDMHDVIYSIEHDAAALLAYTVGTLGNPALNGDVEDVGLILSREENLPLTGEFADQLETQLALIPTLYLVEQGYDLEDALYGTLVSFAAELQEVAALVVSGGTEQEIANRMGEAIHTLKSGLNLALEQQTATKEECVYVVEKLCSIFGLAASECPADPDPEYTKEEDDEFTDVGGGAGSGEMQYAGDEQVYDYKQDTHVSYTEVVAEYYASMLQASLEGGISEEMLEFIMKYFSQLYTG